ncbi:MAG: hypothetical protein R3311_09365, partial [Oceanisphaera sp.]|nr:hypothetical protein [Oceanisphaera sp.]
MSHLVIAPLLLPLLAGIALLLLRSSDTPVRRTLSVVATLMLVVFALLLLQKVGDGTVLVYNLGNWSAPFG